LASNSFGHRLRDGSQLLHATANFPEHFRKDRWIVNAFMQHAITLLVLPVWQVFAAADEGIRPLGGFLFFYLLADALGGTWPG